MRLIRPTTLARTLGTRVSYMRLYSTTVNQTPSSLLSSSPSSTSSSSLSSCAPPPTSSSSSPPFSPLPPSDPQWPTLGPDTPLGLPAYRTVTSQKASLLVASELDRVRESIPKLVSPGLAQLARIARHAFNAQGKAVRPTIVLLMAQATNGLTPISYNQTLHDELSQPVDDPISEPSVLLDPMPDHALPPTLATDIWPTQRRLAEITEVIHVATLLHDDVIDGAPIRRGQASAPAGFGNRRAIQAGNFLLGRASAALARLRSPPVVELVATIIDHLVEGELMQLRAQAGQKTQSAWLPTRLSLAQEALPEGQKGPSQERFDDYLAKTYLKTAALIAKSSLAATLLGGHGAERVASMSVAAQKRAAAVRHAALEYGTNVGIAFQLIDDVLDVRATQAVFGKPSGGADLRLGLATGPVLFAWQAHPDSVLGTLVDRKFSHEGDVALALDLVAQSDGIDRTADLAAQYVQRATDAMLILPPSPARDALIQLATNLLERAK